MIATLIAAGVFDAGAIVVPPVDFSNDAPASRIAKAQPQTTALKWLDKDPDETLDYGVDVSLRIEDPTDAIASTQAVVLNGGLVVLAHYATPTQPQQTTTWLMGGTEGQMASVRVRSTTVKGRVIDQTVTQQILTR